MHIKTYLWESEYLVPLILLFLSIHVLLFEHYERLLDIKHISSNPGKQAHFLLYSARGGDTFAWEYASKNAGSDGREIATPQSIGDRKFPALLTVSEISFYGAQKLYSYRPLQ